MTRTLSDLPLLASGKVREIYDLGDKLLLVASDRISTYDVVHPTPIPDKGKVLTGLSAFWFAKTGHIVANHLLSNTDGVPDEARGRAQVVRKLDMLPVECVVRGYITGSGWKDYQATGTVSGVELPPGLREAERLPTPVFTPSTKAEVGHDEAIDFDAASELVGNRELMGRVRDASIELYRFAAEHARSRGVDPGRHEVRVRARRGRRARGGRRGADARQLALLARRRLRARPRAAVLRQAVRARLGGRQRLGQGPARPGAPGRRGRAHAGAVRRGLRAPGRRALRRVAGADGAVRARVLIRPKAGILDPQGIAVERALPALGFEGVRNVHVGRLVELDVDDPGRLDEMCRRLLANPLVEDFEVLPADDPAAGRA